MQISLSKDTNNDNSKEIRVLVKISATDDEQVELIYSHSFDLQHIEAGRSIADQVFNKKPKTADLRKYGKLLFRALFSENDASPARQLLDEILPPHPSGRILIQLNGDQDLDVIPWEYAWGNHAYLIHQCVFARMHNIVPDRSKPAPGRKLLNFFVSSFRSQNQTEPNRTGVDHQKELQHPKSLLRIVAVVPDPVVPPDNPGATLSALNLNDQFQNFINNHFANKKKVILERVFPPTVDQMDVVLMNSPETATVLHFMGHCTSNNGARALIFEDKETGEPEFVDTTHLIVPKHLRLAFLSACNTRDVARVLLEHGVPYTVGSYCDMPDDLAREFESKFYQVLSSGSTVEKAMWRARVFLHNYDNVRQRDYFPGAMVLYSSTIREDVGAFEGEIGDPIVNLHMPRNNLHILHTSPFFGRKKELVDLNSVLKRMANRCHQTSGVVTIEGISGVGKTALAIEAVRRSAHLFPGGIFAWQFDSMGMSFIEYLKRLVEVVFPDEVQSRLKHRSDGGAEDVRSLKADIIREFEGYPECLLILDHADALKLAEEGDENGMTLRGWLRQIATTSTVAVKILATSNEPLGWMGEIIVHLDGLDIDSGVNLFIRNLDTQVLQRMEKEENAEKVLRDLVRVVDGHPLCLESLAHAVGLPQNRNVSLQELSEYFSTMLVDGSLGSRNLESRFRPTLDMLPTQQRLILYMCSLFTGPITKGVLEFVRHFVECFDTSQNGIDSSEVIATNLQQLHGRGLLSKQDEEYRIQFALREGARLCNSMLKFRLGLPIPSLFDDTFVIGVVGPSPHVNSMALEWQLRRIQANAHRELKTRGFGIHYYSIGNEGLRIFKINGTVGDSIDNDSLAKVAPHQDALYHRLAVFIYNTSEGGHDSIGQFCNEQIIPLVQEKQMTFILCLNHTDDKFVERPRAASVLTRKAAAILRNSLEMTHWIIRTEAPNGIVQTIVNSASNENINLVKPVKRAYHKRNDNLRMEGSFIGRTKDLENLIKLLEGPERYITIKGFGGMGKTSLALQVFNHYNSGSALALSLAGAPRSSQVILKIAEFFAIDTKDLNEQDQQSQVQQNLEGEEKILLYLDNMEDVKNAMQSRDSETKKEARELLSFLKGLPLNVKILATSRIALDWPGEYLFDLAGLDPYEGMLVFQQWTPQRSEAGDTDDRSRMELSRVTDGHPLSLRLLGGIFDNSKEPIEQFVDKVRERLSAAVNEEFIYERHESINACIKYSFDFLDDALQTFLGRLREWNVPFTSTLVIRALNHDTATSPVATNLHKLWQRSWLNRRKYEVDPMLGDWRPEIIENETEFYSLHPRLHDFLNHRFHEVEATLPNDAEIQFYTALCYGVGFGVAYDLAKQIEWCTKAEENGHLEARLTLAACYDGGCGVEGDQEKAFNLYLKAAEAGSKQAQSEIALWYRNGWGSVEVNVDRANYWEKKGDKTAPLLIKFDLSLPLIHRAAKGGNMALVRSLCMNISNVSIRDRNGRTPLHMAAQNGHIDLIESLLDEFHADISSVDLYDDTPLHLAAQSGHPEVVWLFVTDFGIDPNSKGCSGQTPLHYAAIEGHLEVVRLLLADSKANANDQTDGGWTPLHCATSIGHVDIVKLLLADSEADVNAKHNNGWTPLHHAAYNGNVDIVRLLLADPKTDANAKTNNGETAIHTAAASGSVEVVRLLIVEFGADVNSKANDGGTALYAAAQDGYVEVVRLLVTEFGADTGTKTNDGRTPLHQAATIGDVDIVSLLLTDSKADVNAKDFQGWTPLHQAAYSGNVDIVKLLLADPKADANAKTNDGWTPLHRATSKGHVEVVRLLLADSKADANAKTNDGMMVLHIAASGGLVEVVRLLIVEFEADANAKTNDGETSLHAAAQYGHVEVVRLLMTEFGADANTKTNDGWMPLHQTAANGHVDIVKLFLADPKADVNANTNAGSTPLHKAAQNGHVEVVKVLMADFKADANAKTNDGETAIHAAAQYGHVEVVRLLVTEFRADANAKTNDGWIPLHQAATNGHVDIVRLLLADSKADANANTNAGGTPLHKAAQNGHVEIVKVLLADSTADANAREEGDWTPLHFATQNGHIGIVRLLLADSKADANAKTNDGETTLHTAAAGGSVEVVRLLIVEFGADANAKTNDGETVLHAAAQHGYVEVVRLLVTEFGADVNAKTNDGWMPLHQAANYGHVEIVRLFLANSMADANANTNAGSTPLHKAAQNGHVEVAKMLMADSKAYANARDEEDWTPLHFAAQNGHIDVVRLLLADSKANANAKTIVEETPLLIAVRNGHVEIVRLLLADAKVDANAKTKVKDTSLHIAAQYGHVDIVKLLLTDFKADANAKNGAGLTPLFLGAQSGHIEILQLLVNEFNMNFNVKAEDDQTLLHFAAQGGCIELARTLTKNFGADANAKANDGRTLLHFAAQYGRVAMVELLIAEFGAEVNALNNEGQTPLQLAIERPIHSTFFCGGCMAFPITGERYNCTTCISFDFCSSCYSKEPRIHGNHSFRLIELTKVTVEALKDIQ